MDQQTSRLLDFADSLRERLEAAEAANAQLRLRLTTTEQAKLAAEQRAEAAERERDGLRAEFQALAGRVMDLTCETAREFAMLTLLAEEIATIAAQPVKHAATLLELHRSISEVEARPRVTPAEYWQERAHVVEGEMSRIGFPEDLREFYKGMARVYRTLEREARRGQVQPAPAPAARKPGSPEHVALWDAINLYTQTCGADPSKRVYGNTPRMEAVVAVERALDAMAVAQAGSQPARQFEPGNHSTPSNSSAPAAAERAVPVGMLRELMRDWRTRGAEGKAVREAYGWAADELEALVSGGDGMEGESC